MARCDIESERAPDTGSIVPAAQRPIEPAAEGFRGKRAVIFGAGYVGGAVAERLVASGAEVFALTRNAGRAAELRGRGVSVCEAQLADLARWGDRVPSEVDFVLNAVGAGGGGVEGYRASYVRGFEALLTWAERVSARATLVYTSSTSVYPQSGGLIVDETVPIGGEDERTQLLIEAERLAQRWPGGATVLRLAGLYGPGRHHLLDQLRQGVDVMSGRPEVRLNLAHRDDVLAAVLAAWRQPERAAGEVFNVADDAATAKATVVGWLAQRLERSVPAFSGEPAPGRRRVTPDRVISNAKLKTRLGWRPLYPSFREGYERLLR